MMRLYQPCKQNALQQFRFLPLLALLLFFAAGQTCYVPSGAQPRFKSVTRDRQLTYRLTVIYTPHIPRRAIRYQRTAYALGLFSIVWHVLGLWLLLQSGLSARIRDKISQGGRSAQQSPAFRTVALFVLVYMLIMLLWSLPISIAGYNLEHHFGFSRQTAAGFVIDHGRGLLINLIFIPLIWGTYWLQAKQPRRWWLILWALALPLLCTESILQPILIAPIYNNFTPLPAGRLRNDLLALAARSGITNAHVFVADSSRRTTHVNAYVTGIGPTTRIVIEDTALRLLPEDQLLAMMGHEMGHYVERHVWVLLISNVLGAGIFLWLIAALLPRLIFRKRRVYGLKGIKDVAALPLVLLMLYVMLEIQMPVANALSRYLEHRADAFGLQTTHLNEASARLYVGFAERDYSDPDPPLLLHLWFGTHPTLKERIDYALHFQAANQ